MSSGALAVLKRRMVPLNDIGRRIGEAHPRAKLTDAQVDQVWALREQGWSYNRIAKEFKVSKGCIWKILDGRRRGQWAARWIFQEGQ